MTYWLLQCNPQKWRIFDYLAAGNEIDSWSVGRYLDQPTRGDEFALWLTGPDGGVGAFGTVLGPPEEAGESTWDDEYWTDPEQAENVAWDLPIRVTEDFLRRPIPRDQIRADPRLAGMQILRNFMSTNPFQVTADEWAALQALHNTPETPTVEQNWELSPGDTILRTELHRRYGGSGQDGVAPSRTSPNILIFTDPKSGRQHGYYDEWAPDGSFHYTGRGQRGPQTFTSGNKAIRDHIQDNRSLRLFEGAGGRVRYVGEFAIDVNDPFHWGEAPETGGGPLRPVIRFHLQRVAEKGPRPQTDPGVPYREQDEDATPSPAATPAPADPDAAGRGLRAHRRLQNQLAKHVRD